MAQHDYVIDNQASASARADLNNLFQAIASQNSGATAPTTTYANMMWYDTTANLLKMRNEANSAWITLGTLDQALNTFTAPSVNGKTINTLTAAGGIAYASNTTTLAAIGAGTAGQALLSGGAGAPTWGSISVVNYQLFTATGTWTKPAGISANAVVHFHIIGGGAGGTAYFRGSSTLRYVCGGSGGGGYIGSVLASSLGATVSVTVGAGGTLRTASGSGTTSIGGSGGASSFGSFIAEGGSGGGVSASAGFITKHGYDGHIGGDSSSDANDQTTINSIYGGGGGGSGFSASAYAPGVGYIGGGNGGTQANGSNAVATAGSAPGGGGGAAHSSSTTTSGTVTSGAGARGEVRVWTIG